MSKLATLWRRPDPPQAVAAPLGRGYVDGLKEGEGGFHVAGWLFSHGRRLDAVELSLDGAPVARVVPALRPDVRDCFPAIPEAADSGFYFFVPFPDSHRRSPGTRIEVVGRAGDEIVGRLRWRYYDGFHDDLPDPPANLRDRVIGTESLPLYWLSGLQTLDAFEEPLRRWRRRPLRRLLDWGCGCGRLTSFLARELPATEVHGCDIDGEAIAWCRASLGERFAVVEPSPPTPYPSRFFDAVVSYSVLTHLSRTDQLAWLGEMRRILAPRGLVLATIHGDYATTFRDGRVQAEVAVDGISDWTPDPRLDGVAAGGYYRSTFQNRSYSERAYSAGFEVLEILPRAVMNFQDLVVLRRR